MNRIMIRTLGGKGIGYGHYYRCLSLAKAIKSLEKDIDIIFVVNQELTNLITNTEFNFIVKEALEEDYLLIGNLEVKMFIFDSYLGHNDYLREIKKRCKLMLIDDNNDIYDSTIPDIIYNGNIHADNLGYPEIKGQLKLLGSRYLIMKEEYWEKHQDEDIERRGILITTGGTDEYGITLEILKSIQKLDIDIKVVLGPGFKEGYIKKIEAIINDNIELIYMPQSLKEYISSAKIVITASGSTVYEVLSQKSIPIIFSIADNQDLIYQELSRSGISHIGKYPDIDCSVLPEVIRIVLENNSIPRNQRLSFINAEGARVSAKILLEKFSCK